MIQHPHHIASTLPQSHVLQGVMCIACLCLCIWLVFLVGMSVLLFHTNVPPVHEACPGLWDFVLVSLVLPVVAPCLYMMTEAWSTLSIALCVFLSLLGTFVSLNATRLPLCVETLRQITPPLPWLLLVAWAKTVAYMSGALHGLDTRRQSNGSTAL